MATQYHACRPERTKEALTSQHQRPLAPALQLDAGHPLGRADDFLAAQGKGPDKQGRAASLDTLRPHGTAARRASENVHRIYQLQCPRRCKGTGSGAPEIGAFVPPLQGDRVALCPQPPTHGPATCLGPLVGFFHPAQVKARQLQRSDTPHSGILRCQHQGSHAECLIVDLPECSGESTCCPTNSMSLRCSVPGRCRGKSFQVTQRRALAVCWSINKFTSAQTLRCPSRDHWPLAARGTIATPF